MLLGIVSLTPAPASAAVQALDTIRRVASEFALQRAESDHGGHVTATVGRLDNRLRLPACSTTLVAFSAPGRQSMGRLSVGVRCDSPATWTVFVPVHVQVFRKVTVAATTIPHHTPISAAMLRTRERDIGRLQHGYYLGLEAVLGKQLRHTVAEGTAIFPDMIWTPRLVRRGQRVSIRGGSPRVRVSALGVALADGKKGDRVRVRNLKSGRIIEGEIIAKNTVQVP